MRSKLTTTVFVLRKRHFVICVNIYFIVRNSLFVVPRFLQMIIIKNSTGFIVGSIINKIHKTITYIKKDRKLSITTLFSLLY